MEKLLCVNDITKVYPTQPKPGLDHVSFDVMKGEFLGIMGASGSGKTTLLNVLSTIDRPTSGDISMGKTKIQELNQTQAADFRKNNLGFIFQEYFLLDSLTVQENIAVPLTLLHKSTKEIDTKVNDFAEMFGIASQLKKYPNELSGGQRQRVAAARAMVKRPPLIFADEPTGALDSSSATELLFALSEVNQAFGTTILMVTHDPYAASYTDRILYFKDGHIISELKRCNSERRDFYEEIMQEVARQDEKR
ncbi:ABC transporter ATP-binding protein [Mediterraneibacter glycyrrhizinilyticus]|nr:ABC transporter ATP-binding protein [Mediterraneibacter glycyrrhizinilyticus]MBM6804572.1 ABC transporter ATP-binding protein [Mediterraneibacter glycyrrhizinilyticus]